MGAKSIRNGKIAGNPSVVYDELVNRDFAPSPHTYTKSELDYWLIKRESYRKTQSSFSLQINNRYMVTDILTMDDRGCAGGECKEYYYVVNQNRTKGYVFVREGCGPCEGDYKPVRVEFDRCPCAYDKFYDTDGPIGVKFSDFDQYTVSNDGLFGYANVNEVVALQANAGDYVTITGGGTAPCGQTRQVLGKERNDDGTVTIQVDGPRTGVLDGEDATAIEIVVSEDYGAVPGFIGDGGFYTIDTDTDRDVGFCERSGDDCIVSVAKHNGVLNYLNLRLYSFFGGTLFDTNLFTSNQFQRVGKDKTDMISFRNFLVFFGKKEISTAVFNESGDTSFLYNLTNDIGIYNKGAASVFDNGLFFVGSDKRVYGASINSAGNGIFDLQLEDITLNVMGHMDRLQEGDEVYMDSYSDRLYIFINGRHTTDSFYTGKTKILIYDKTYKQRLVHTLCGDVINGIRCGKFIGDDVYQYCGRDGDGDPGFGTGYDAVATAVLYRNNQNSGQDSSGITLDMFRRHKILNMIVLLARSRYSSDTYIDVTKYDKIASRYQYQMKEDEITEMWNDIRNCNEPRIPKCLTSSLSKCANTNNDCEGSGHNCEVKENDCCEKPRVFDDYCICYDDAGYEVSPIHKYKLTFNESYADYWKISLVSSGDNVAYFGGFMVGTETQSSFDADVDEFSTGECVQEKKCKQCTS